MSLGIMGGLCAVSNQKSSQPARGSTELWLFRDLVCGLQPEIISTRTRFHRIKAFPGFSVRLATRNHLNPHAQASKALKFMISRAVSYQNHLKPARHSIKTKQIKSHHNKSNLKQNKAKQIKSKGADFHSLRVPVVMNDLCSISVHFRAMRTGCFLTDNRLLQKGQKELLP